MSLYIMGSLAAMCNLVFNLLDRRESRKFKNYVSQITELLLKERGVQGGVGSWPIQKGYEHFATRAVREGYFTKENNSLSLP